MMPASNVQHLMLRTDVVEAVENGDFHVWAVSTIDEGIEVLTGLPAGERKEEGGWTQGSINDLVDQRLEDLGQRLRDWGKASEKGTTEVVTPVISEGDKPPEPPKPPDRPDQ
jgi:predicted ATP-dependent protease